MAALKINKHTIAAIFCAIGFVLLVAAWAGMLIGKQYAVIFKIILIIGLLFFVPALIINRVALTEFMISYRFRQLSSFVLFLGFVFGIVVMVYLVAGKVEKRVDLTTAGMNSLSEQSTTILDQLSDPVKITAFFPTTDPYRSSVRGLLDQYEYSGDGKVSYEFVDPDRSPGIAKAYGIQEYGTVFVESGERRQRVMELSENGFANALLKLKNVTQKKILFLSGHGEPSLDKEEAKSWSMLKHALEQDNFEVAPVELMRTETLPEHVACLVIGPTQIDLFDKEVETIQFYLESGGSLLVLAGPELLPSVRTLIESQGIIVGDDRVIDPLSRLIGADATSPLITQYVNHPITERFDMASVMPLTRSIRSTPKAQEEGFVTEMAFSSPQSWGETDLTSFEKGEVKFDEKEDLKGPVSVAAIIEKPIHAPTDEASDERKIKTTRMVVFGSSRFVANAALSFPGGNRDLILNSFQWLSGEEDLISIRPKDISQSLLLINQIQARLVFFIPVVIVPLIPLILGVIVFWRRRIFN